MCRLPYDAKDVWSPDGALNIKREHCSKRCYRMYKVAYMSDNAFRIEHSIRKAREEFSNENMPLERQTELKKWIKALERRLTNIKRTRRINRRCRSLSTSNRSNGFE
jgi:hypothetical protein